MKAFLKEFSCINPDGNLIDPEERLSSLLKNAQHFMNRHPIPGWRKDKMPVWIDEVTEPMLVYCLCVDEQGVQRLAPEIIIPKSWDNFKLRDGAGGLFSFNGVEILGLDKTISDLIITAHVDGGTGKVIYRDFKTLKHERRDYQERREVTDVIKIGKTTQTNTKQITINLPQAGNSIKGSGVYFEHIENLHFKGIEADVGLEGISSQHIGNLTEQASIRTTAESFGESAGKGKKAVSVDVTLLKHAIEPSIFKTTGKSDIRANNMETHSARIEAEDDNTITIETRAHLGGTVVSNDIKPKVESSKKGATVVTGVQQNGLSTALLSRRGKVGVYSKGIIECVGTQFTARNIQVKSAHGSTFRELHMETRLNILSSMQKRGSSKIAEKPYRQEYGMPPVFIVPESGDVVLEAENGDLLLVDPVFHAKLENIIKSAPKGQVRIIPAVYYSDQETEEQAAQSRRTAKRKKRQGIAVSLIAIGAGAAAAFFLAPVLLPALAEASSTLGAVVYAGAQGAISGAVTSTVAGQNILEGTIKGAAFAVLGAGLEQGLSSVQSLQNLPQLQEGIAVGTTAAVSSVVNDEGNVLKNIAVAVAANTAAQTVAPSVPTLPGQTPSKTTMAINNARARTRILVQAGTATVLSGGNLGQALLAAGQGFAHMAGQKAGTNMAKAVKPPKTENQRFTEQKVADEASKTQTKQSLSGPKKPKAPSKPTQNQHKGDTHYSQESELENAVIDLQSQMAVAFDTKLSDEEARRMVLEGRQYAAASTKVVPPKNNVPKPKGSEDHIKNDWVTQRSDQNLQAQSKRTFIENLTLGTASLVGAAESVVDTGAGVLRLLSDAETINDGYLNPFERGAAFYEAERRQRALAAGIAQVVHHPIDTINAGLNNRLENIQAHYANGDLWAAGRAEGHLAMDAVSVVSGVAGLAKAGINLMGKTASAVTKQATAFAADKTFRSPITIQFEAGRLNCGLPIDIIKPQKPWTKRGGAESVISASKPAEIYHGYAELSARQSRLLERLPRQASSIQILKSDINAADLAALTAKTGDEFAMFTLGSRRIIIRGNNNGVNIKKWLPQLQSEGWTWSAHTHPGIRDTVLNASGIPGDRQVLKLLNQERSLILNSGGR